MTDSSTPVTVSNLSGVMAVTTGDRHSCALLNSGAVHCWGLNDQGQLGNGSMTDSSTPVAVSGLNSGVTAIIAGIDQTCALLDDGTLRCWGRNDEGQLGNGSMTDSLTPVAVSGLNSGVTAIAAGPGSLHTCAALNDGTARCWGWGIFGRLGDGTSMPRVTPVAVSNLSDVRAIAVDNGHSCALLNSGAMRCWGGNFAGQLGNGSMTDSSTPVVVMGVSGVRAITLGGSHTCALLDDGTLRCWGNNNEGRLGNGNMTDSPTPVTVSGLSGVSIIDAGNGHTCAILSGNTVRCWGRNDEGQLGNGSMTVARL